MGMNNLITAGEVKIICISPKKYSAEWAAEAKTWAKNWSIVASEDAVKEFDLRIAPSVYLIDGEHKIVEKNILVDMLIR